MLSFNEKVSENGAYGVLFDAHEFSSIFGFKKSMNIPKFMFNLFECSEEWKRTRKNLK